MKKVNGTNNKYLKINLNDHSWSVYQISDKDREKYLGGKGLALKIYYDHLKEGLSDIDPLGEENILIFAMGTILSTGAPCSARFEVYAKSPLTGLLFGSSCGGPFGEACKTAGWDGVILTGKSPDPVVLKFNHDSVEFVEAGELWGMNTEELDKALSMSAREAYAVIGPAGEAGVLMASIKSGHRFAGRGGLGAVMGSKKVKAIVARGFSHKMEPVHPAGFKKATKKLKKYIHRSEFLKSYRLYGTNAGVRFGIKSGYSPVRNFRDRYHPAVEQTSGEAMAERYTTRSSSCRHCSINCGHKGHYKDGKLHQIPEYETNGMFGSNIENYDTDLIIEWNDLMNSLGMDTISVGGTLAWAMEAAEKGIRKSELEFGKFDNISQIINDIAYLRGEGRELAMGSRWLSEKYGGSDFAIQVKGLEVAAYDPRAAWGQGLSYAVANRGGCHLGSYLVGMEILFPYMKPLSLKGKAEWAIFYEDLFAAMNSLQICQFTGYGILAEYPVPKYIPPVLLRPVVAFFPRLSQLLMNWAGLSQLYTGLTGIKMSQKGILRAGERINKLERWMDFRMNPAGMLDELPGRFLNEKETKFQGKNTVVPLDKLLEEYYLLRRYSAIGEVSESDLRRLDVDL